MIIGNYLAAAAVFGLGLYTILTSRNIIKIVMGLSLMEAASYLLLLSLGYRNGATAPVLTSPPAGQTSSSLARGNVTDPMLQNVCLTAIIIGVAVTAVFLTVAVRIAQHYQSIDTDDLRSMRG